MTRRHLAPAIAVVAAVAALGLAAVAVLRRGGGPPQPTLSLAAIDAAYGKARACLIGDPPASDLAAEALAAADLAAPDRTCGPELVALAAAAGGAPELAPLRDALPRVAEAFLQHTRALFAEPDQTSALPTYPAVPADKVDAFTAALVAFDAVVDAAGLAVTRRPARGHALPELAPTPLLADGAPTALNTIGASSLYVHPTLGGIGADAYAIVFRGGQPLAFREIHPSTTVRSAGATWESWVADDQVMAATLGGAVRAVGRGAGYTSIRAVLGDGDDRLVVVEDERRVWLGRSADGGRSWQRVTLAEHPDHVAVAASANGIEVVLGWSPMARIELTTANARGALPTATAVGEVQVVQICAEGAVWLALATADGYAVRRADASGELARLRDEVLVDGCSAELLVITSGGHQLACTRAVCRPLPDLPRATQTLVIGEHVVRVAQLGDTLAAWWDGQPPTFARVPLHHAIRGVLRGDDRAIAILAKPDDNVGYAELPR